MTIGHDPLRHALDEGRWTGFQKRAAAFAILAVILDGFDIQLLGVAIPAMMKDWALPRQAFVPALAFGLLAMSVGTAVNGRLGDRFGRKSTLVASLLVFGAATLGSAAVDTIGGFLATRIVASLGLGGAMPSAVALLSEFTPRRRRSAVVTLGMICTPVGGVLAGLVAAQVLPGMGWRPMFVIGGLLPLALGAVLIALLPESPGFLSVRPHRRAELDRLAAKLGVGADAAGTPAAATADAAPVPAEEEGGLLSPGSARTSLLLWVQFLAVLTAAYTMFNWLPTLIAAAGYPLAAGGTLLAAFNFGGIGGALLGAACIDRTGSRRLTAGFGAGAVIATLAMLALFAASVGLPVLLLAMAASGAFIAGLQPMLFALAAHAYGTARRTTGVGTALAIGRVGAIASSFVGSALIGAGPTAFFGFLAVLMVAATAALLLFDRHVPTRAAAAG